MRPFYHEGQVEVDGETLHLVCNFRAIDVIESVTGQKMTEILPQLLDPPHALVGKVLWGLLREKHETSRSTKPPAWRSVQRAIRSVW
jgi:hypothetical protein